MKIGDIHSYWTVSSLPFRNKHLHVSVRCVCGVAKIVRVDHLLSGNSKSCGCKTVEIIRAKVTRHGDAGRGVRTPEHVVWSSMQQRCSDPNNKSFANYGGRGIKVYPWWSGKYGFANFLADMGRRPTPRHTIERNNNAGNYEPGNCRWATRSEQGLNKQNNHLLLFRGESLPVAEWARRLNLSRKTITTRLRAGWSDEDTLAIPVNTMKRNGRANECVL